MPGIREKDKKVLLNLARQSITSVFDGLKVKLSDISDIMKEKCGVFVTLTINGELRGCIGNIEPIEEIYKAVIKNADSAAFNDPRFPSLMRQELKEIKIEISILTKPEKLKVKDFNELIMTLDKEKPGLIIDCGGYNKATFLPQVWEELKTPQEFLTNLCMKAGLTGDYWKSNTSNIEFSKYFVQSFAEQ